MSRSVIPAALFVDILYRINRQIYKRRENSSPVTAVGAGKNNTNMLKNKMNNER